MRLPALAAVATVVICAALLAAGCGGGSGSSKSTAPSEGGANGGGGGNPGGPKKATAPNAPAGSRVVECKERAADAGELRATAVDCGAAVAVMRKWGDHQGCALAKRASRNSCSLDGFRCQAVRTGGAATVSCARPGGDVSFVAKTRRLKEPGGR